MFDNGDSDETRSRGLLLSVDEPARTVALTRAYLIRSRGECCSSDADMKPLSDVYKRSEYSTDARPLQSLPSSFATDAGRVLDACLAGTHLQLRLGFLRDEFYEDRGVVWVVDADGEGFGFALCLSARRGELLATLGNGIQEYISEFDETWGMALPPCPGHMHPMMPVADDDRAWWACPETGRHIQAMGAEK